MATACLLRRVDRRRLHARHLQQVRRGQRRHNGPSTVLQHITHACIHARRGTPAKAGLAHSGKKLEAAGWKSNSCGGWLVCVM